MSLQDDIFDVENALKGKAELKSFKHIMAKFYVLEDEDQNQKKVLKSLGEGIRALRWIETEYSK